MTTPAANDAAHLPGRCVGAYGPAGGPGALHLKSASTAAEGSARPAIWLARCSALCASPRWMARVCASERRAALRRLHCCCGSSASAACSTCKHLRLTAFPPHRRFHWHGCRAVSRRKSAALHSRHREQPVTDSAATSSPRSPPQQGFTQRPAPFEKRPSGLQRWLAGLMVPA